MDTTNKKIIPVEVRGEYILGSGVSIGAMGSFDVTVLQATFDESWVGLTKYATWTDALGNVGEQILFTELNRAEDTSTYTYNIPITAFPLRHAGTVKLSFTGYVVDGDKIKSAINTATGTFRVLESNATRIGDDVVDPSLGEQLHAAIDATEQRMKAVEEGEAERDRLFGEAEAARNEEFVAKEAERKSEFDASYAEIKAQYDALGVVQTPGNSETQVMSQKAVTEYVPKVATRNLLNVTWVNANLNSSGQLVNATNTLYASTPEYIAVKGGETYTLSWIKNDNKVHIYCFEYKADHTFIKYTNIGATNIVTPRQFTVDAECAYVRIKLWKNGTALPSFEENIPQNFQMELGTVATSYIKPVVIDNEEIDDVALADRMRAKGKLPREDQYIDTLPTTKNPSVDDWEAASINANGEEVVSTHRLRTKEYIQMRKGDTVTVTEWANFDVFEYDLITKEFISSAYTSGWKRSYTVQNDCYIRIIAFWDNTPENIDVINRQLLITRNTDTQVQFSALPIDKLREFTETVVTEQTDGIEKEFVTTTKFSATKNTLFKQSAHRGYRGTNAPQCTAPAYIEAKKFGFDVGENDLWVTSDGVFVMAHDTTLPSDRSIVIANSTYETLLAGNMGTFNGKEVKIMTFEEWLILMKKIGLEPFVDIKSILTAEQATEVVAIVRKHGLLDKVTWCTSASVTLQGIRTAYPKARLALLNWTSITQGSHDYRIEGRPDLTILYPQSTKVTAEVVENAHNAGVGVECWHCDYSANGFTTEEAILGEVERVVELGVTGICLDTYLPCDYFIKKLNAEWGLE